ncbi:MAG: hypothetical protein IPM29_12540 [Planctomycetes bacterium]|nr:hypothetical protein [Planctomycetota bacterium]
MPRIPSPTRLAGLLLTPAVLVCGCEQRQRGHVEPPALQLSPTVFELVDAGAEPRRELRLHPSPAAVERATLTVTNQQTIGREDRTDELPARTLQIPFDVRVEAAPADAPDALQYVLAYGRLELAGVDHLTEPQRGELDAQLDALAGLRIRALSTRTGETLRVTPEGLDALPESARTQLRSLDQSFEQFATRLPAEPVGLGARWQVSRGIAIRGIECQQTTTYEVRALDGDHVELAVTVALGAELGPVRMPGLPEDATALLQRFDGHGTGTFVLDLGSVLPRSIELSAQSELRVELRQGDDVRVRTFGSRESTRLERRE